MVWLRVPSLRQGDALCLNAAINACKKASPGVSVAKAMLLDDRECLFTSIGDYHGLSSSMESLSMNQSNSRMIQNWTSLLVVKLLGYIPSISPLYHIIFPVPKTSETNLLIYVCHSGRSNQDKSWELSNRNQQGWQIQPAVTVNKIIQKKTRICIHINIYTYLVWKGLWYPEWNPYDGRSKMTTSFFFSCQLANYTLRPRNLWMHSLQCVFADSASWRHEFVWIGETQPPRFSIMFRVKLSV